MERTLHGCNRLKGMQVTEPWKGSNILINLGVVLHRARTKWIKFTLNRVIPLGQACEVPNNVKFA